MNLNDRFLQLALSGSEWILWLLVAMSVASLTIIFERAIAYRGIARRERKLAEASGTRLRALATRLDTPGARILHRVASGSDDVALTLESARGAEKVRLERNLAVLGTIGANAPFVGLLGTVLEILRVFHLLGEQGVTTAQDAAGIMTGISGALVATGVGLFVAIPATAAYNAFLRRVSALLSGAQDTASRVLAAPSEEPV